MSLSSTKKSLSFFYCTAILNGNNQSLFKCYNSIVAALYFFSPDYSVILAVGR